MVHMELQRNAAEVQSVCRRDRTNKGGEVACEIVVAFSLLLWLVGLMQKHL